MTTEAIATDSERQANYKGRMEDKGFMLLRRWVHKSRFEDLDKQSKTWRKPKRGS